jgi:hypothetical protein
MVAHVSRRHHGYLSACSTDAVLLLRLLALQVLLSEQLDHPNLVKTYTHAVVRWVDGGWLVSELSVLHCICVRGYDLHAVFHTDKGGQES